MLLVQPRGEGDERHLVATQPGSAQVSQVHTQVSPPEPCLPPQPRWTAAGVSLPLRAEIVTGGAQVGARCLLLGALTSSKKERALMATPRLWAAAPRAPRRCSTSDTVPMTCTTTCSLFWKKPLRKGGSCPQSRLP